MNDSNFYEKMKINSGISIDLKALFMEFLDKLVIIVLGGIAAAMVILLLYSTVLRMDYESVTKIYIKPQDAGNNSAYVSLEVGSLLTTDYSEMILGRDTMEDTIMHFGLDTNYEKFRHKIKVNNPTDTRILEIAVRDKDPYMARNIAIYIRDSAIRAIEEKMSNEGISVIQQANLPIKTVTSVKIAASIFGLLVMIILTIIIIIRYLVIDTLVTADDIETRMKIPVLGTIAYEKGDSDR